MWYYKTKQLNSNIMLIHFSISNFTRHCFHKWRKLILLVFPQIRVFTSYRNTLVWNLDNSIMAKRRTIFYTAAQNLQHTQLNLSHPISTYTTVSQIHQLIIKIFNAFVIVCLILNCSMRFQIPFGVI